MSGSITLHAVTTSSSHAAPACNPLARSAELRFRSLVDDHFDFVWRSLRGLGVEHGGADDAAQQVFCIAARKLAAIDNGAERAFLFGIARGVAANVRRAQTRAPEPIDPGLLEDWHDHSPDAEQVLEDREARAILDGVLASMPEDLRTVFVLFELEEMSMAEIAPMIGIPPGTVASRLRRAREQFRAATDALARGVGR
jgi:RNA polymerase sigma-70 factor (ECF subfamily)